MSHNQRSIGAIELRSIAKGIEATDAMLKTADVFTIFSGTVCPGKYLIVIGGDVGAVENSMNTGEETCSDYMVDSTIIPNVSEQVFPAIECRTDIGKLKALAIIETFSLVGSIRAGDIMVKAADISLIEIRLAKGLGGKAFAIGTGEVGDCEAAVNAVVEEFKGNDLMIENVVIPSPHAELEEIIF